MVLFGSGFALMYAPLLRPSSGCDVPKAKGGIAIGFYNLTINMAVPIGIAFAAKLVNLELGLTRFARVSPPRPPRFGVLILAVIAVLALLLYRGSIRVLEPCHAQRGGDGDRLMGTAGHVPQLGDPPIGYVACRVVIRTGEPGRDSA